VAGNRIGDALDLSLPGAVFESLRAIAPADGGLAVREWAEAAGGVATGTLTRPGRGHFARLLQWGLIEELDSSRSLDRRRYRVNLEAIEARADLYRFRPEMRSERQREEWRVHDSDMARRAAVSVARADDRAANLAWCAERVGGVMRGDADSIGKRADVTDGSTHSRTVAVTEAAPRVLH
jgi:hypothetical protein